MTGRIMDSFPQSRMLSVRSIRLGLMTRIFSGGTPDKKKMSYWEDGVLPWIGSGEVNQGVIVTPTTYITRSAVQESATKLFPAGSVAMALAGQGKTRATVATMGIDAYGNQSVACIADYRGNSRFLYWWLSSLYKEIRSLSSQDTRDGLNQSMVGQIPIPDYSHDTQTIIADFLDHETTRIDQLINKKQRLVELADEKRSALIIAAVTGQNEAGVGRAGVCAPYDGMCGGTIGNFPQTSWLPVRSTRLGLRSRIFSGGTPNKSRLEFWKDGVLPWIGSGEVNQGIISTPTAYITHSAVQQSATKLFPAGSVAMALAGQGRTKATVAMMGIDAYGNQSLACIADYSGNSRFLFWWLSSLYKEIRGLSSQDTRDGLNQSMVGQIPVPDFPRDLQKTIADSLDRKTADIDAFKMTSCASIMRLFEFRAALITAAVTGQIDVATWRKQGKAERKLDALEHKANT